MEIEGIDTLESWFFKNSHHLLSIKLFAYSVAQSCPTLCDPINCSPPGSSVHGIFQARILKWVVISFSRGFSWSRDQTCVSYISCISRWVIYYCASWEVPILPLILAKRSYGKICYILALLLWPQKTKKVDKLKFFIKCSAWASLSLILPRNQSGIKKVIFTSPM